MTPCKDSTGTWVSAQPAPQGSCRSIRSWSLGREQVPANKDSASCLSCCVIHIPLLLGPVPSVIESL